MTRNWRFAALFLACLIGAAIGGRGVVLLTQSQTHAASPDTSNAPVNLVGVSGPAQTFGAHPSTDARIRRGQEAVRRSPNNVTNYVNLALAYMQKERESNDVTYYTLTDDTLKAALRIDPVNYSANSYRAWVAMGRHDFQAAKAIAERATKLNAYDPAGYADLGDAEANLGQYDAMSRAYQKMVNLKPNLASYDRASYTRWLYGDQRAAILFMTMAIRAGSTQPENMAWVQTQLGEYYVGIGAIPLAQQQFKVALRSFPHYARALAGLAAVEISKQNLTAAVRYYKSAIAIVPLPQYVIALGDVYTRLGDKKNAARQYALVRFINRVFQVNHVQFGIERAAFYADHDQHLAEALRIAHAVEKIRHDIFTEDTLAWTLYKNGRYLEAQEAEKKALRLGTKDPLMFFHAGMILAKLGHLEGAQSYLSSALILNSNFHVLFAPDARTELQRLSGKAVAAAKKP